MDCLPVGTTHALQLSGSGIHHGSPDASVKTANIPARSSLPVSVNGDLVVQQRRRRISDVVLSELQQPRQEEQTQTELKTAVLHFNF